jgi:tetratricopeptide (TPR) repeat protein
MVKRLSIAGIITLLLSQPCGFAKEVPSSGDRYFDNGRLDEAIHEYEKLLEKNKKQPEIYFKLGNAYCKKGNLEKALEAFNLAIQLKPDYAEAYKRLSEVSMQIGAPEDELKVCLKEVQKDPNNADAHLQLGMIYYKRNLLMKQEEYETTIGLEPKKEEAYFNLSVCTQELIPMIGA